MRYWILSLAVLAGGFLLGQNQPLPQKIAMINSEKVIQAHPGFAQVQAVQNQAKTELDPLNARIQPLQQKAQAGTASTAEQQDLQILRTALTDATRRWQARQDAALNPVLQDVDTKLNQLAKSQGIALVLDERIASESALVVYRDESVDLTQALINLFPK